MTKEIRMEMDEITAIECRIEKLKRVAESNRASFKQLKIIDREIKELEDKKDKLVFLTYLLGEELMDEYYR